MQAAAGKTINYAVPATSRREHITDYIYMTSKQEEENIRRFRTLLTGAADAADSIR